MKTKLRHERIQRMVKSINEAIKFTEFCCYDPFDEIYNFESCFYHRSIKPRQFRLGNGFKAVRKNKRAYYVTAMTFTRESEYGLINVVVFKHGNVKVSEWEA